MSISFIVTFLTVTALVKAGDVHDIKKRQIGVLARTGALPQGKRSVEVLARDGELPVRGNTKKEKVNDQILDLLIKELATAEDLARLRVYALTDRLLDSEQENGYDLDKRSVAALARNGELPQKRLTEFVTRSGYLVRPPQEASHHSADLLDPDDFLAGGHPSQSLAFLDTRNVGAAKNFLLENDKRTLASAKNFLFSVNRDSESEKGFHRKRNFGLGQGSGAFPAYPWLNDPELFDYYDFHAEEKKNVGASKNFGKRETDEGKVWEEGKGRTKREANVERAMPYLQDVKDFDDDVEETSEEENSVGKRFLGAVFEGESVQGGSRSWGGYIQKLSPHRLDADLI